MGGATDLPKCRVCGGRHWGTCQGERGAPLVRRAASVTPQLVTPRHAVATAATATPVATPATVAMAATPCPECERLRTEIAQLRQQLRDGKPQPMTAAERMRRTRQRRRDVAGLRW
jgi:hypothetical protein